MPYLKEGVFVTLCAPVVKNYTSYALKNLFEQTPGGFFITNKQFKEAMVRCNFLPVNKNKLNWEFRISLKSPGLK
ncbi:hypothetical protein [Methanosarcina mazei]|uniref:hypothetical protein n=1 Tax=Methanosarcina mazei TaxID=2209 RepID=UPI00064FD1FA|nr:hypothetical protein [Methanosarcina mazei]